MSALRADTRVLDCLSVDDGTTSPFSAGEETCRGPILFGSVKWSSPSTPCSTASIPMASGMLVQNSGALRRGLKHDNFHRHLILLMVGGHSGDRFPGSVFGELDHFLVHLPLPRVQ